MTTLSPSIAGLDLTSTPTASPTPPARIAALTDSPKYGVIFTDHMLTIEWTQERGWHDASLRPREPFRIDPACSVLHYAQEIFEGMKAYRGADDATYLFRPMANATRFQESARRMSMPELPESLFIESVERLVQSERAWIPQGESGSLYLRPFMFATEPFLGVRPSRSYVFCIIASPVGAYFAGGVKPISVWVSGLYARSAHGGTGAAKTGGNYAGSLIAQMEAGRNGCDQVLFLDAAEHCWLEELGGMNIFVQMADGTLITPPLGTILPGITRDSIISLAREEGVVVEEKAYSKDMLFADATAGRVTEVFACGTAAVVTPIGSFRAYEGEVTIGDGNEGPRTRALRERLLGIQRGGLDDGFGWRHRVR
ncbi:branched-chain amino acid aminotransferase [Sphingobium sp.]|uniref:branched-chain amino acid aminotransferase n=1 Tax=Sphingobium sp. TaxID=1912891 RepID=UPI003B3B1FC0